MCKTKKRVRKQEQIIYIEREHAKYSVTGHPLKALYYKLLLKWYEKGEWKWKTENLRSESLKLCIKKI